MAHVRLDRIDATSKVGAPSTSYPLFKNITRLGSDATSDIVLSDIDLDEDYAHIVREDTTFVLSVIGRARPCLIDGKKERRVVLKDGDVIEIGPYRLHYGTGDVDATSPKTHAKGAPSQLGAYEQLVAFSEKLLRSSDLDALLTRLMDSCIELTRADKGFLLYFDNGKAEIKVARNLQRENSEPSLTELSDSIIAKVIREKKPVIISDALHDAEFKSSASVMSLRLCSVMCMPLTEGDEILGLIYLGSNRIAHLFDHDTLAWLSVFAAQASLLVRNAMLLDTLRSDNAALRKSAIEKRFGEIIGSSDVMQDVFKTVHKVAPTDISVLITGETGTGKELIAREIHRRSDRAEQPFIVVNCGAIPDNLLESELFGHVRGAFTGAVNTREGRFQAAHKGTLFLDEIGEMPLALQVKLLRALQDKVITKVGDTRPETVDIRVISATNKNLNEEIKKGTFREDLFYRLNVIGVHLPPLRQRGDDLVLIGRFLLLRYANEYNAKAKGFSPQCITMMKKYGWPGNIRQLDNRIKKAVIMAERVQLGPEDLELSDADVEVVVPLAQAKEDFQRRYINEVLMRNNGNRTKTAHDLGVDPRTIFRHLEREEESP